VTSPKSRFVVSTWRRSTQTEPFQRERRSSTELTPAACFGERHPSRYDDFAALARLVAAEHLERTPGRTRG